MSKVTPTARHSAIAAGTVGLAAFGAVTGVVSAHAAEAPGGLPLSTNAVSAFKNMIVQNHGAVGGIPIQGIPIVGTLPPMLTGALPTDQLPLLGGVEMAGTSPHMRSRLSARPHLGVTPAVPNQPIQIITHPSSQRPPAAVPPAAAPTQDSSPLDAISGLTDGLPGLGSLPLASALGGLGGLGNLSG